MAQHDLTFERCSKKITQQVSIIIPTRNRWDLWVRIAELYPVLATPTPVAIWRRGDSASRQFTSRSEKLHREARPLHREKWLRLPRACDGGAAVRREAARGFAGRAAQQLVWEAGANLKARHISSFARVALAGACMYPLGVSRKILSSTTLRSLMNVSRRPRQVDLT